MLRSVYRRSTMVVQAFVLGAVCILLTSAVMAQEPVGKVGDPQAGLAPGKEELSLVPTKVDVKPVARDEEIRKRLQSVLKATDWFTDPQVRVEEGVVFLNGQVESEVLKKWAGDLARNTQDVVAVANRMTVFDPPVWDFRPATSGVLILWRDFIRSLPLFVFGLFILALSVGASRLATRGALAFFGRRIQAKLLRNAIARGAGILVFLFGFYVVLKVAGLTQLALTVVGGTGLIGLIVGIAFREITENFLASIFLSIQRPFEMGDLVEISGVTGYVQQLNVRTTILMTLDGNIAQIPNATVYKSNLHNFTTNANRREDFVIRIGFGDSITKAQEIARKVLTGHPAVLNDPEPSVLVEGLGTSTVNLRVYFWLNGREYSWIKVRSSIIRLVKLALQQQGFWMSPGEVREIAVPQGIPMVGLDGIPAAPRGADTQRGEPHPVQPPEEGNDAVSTKAEAGLYSEAVIIEEQARQAQPLKDGENLLPVASAAPPSGKQPEEPML
jgi:small conductance mechanosensitive channel